MMQPYASTAEKLARFGLVTVSLLVLLFLIIPVLVIIPLSFNSSSFLTYPMDGFSLRWYEELMTSEEWRQAFKNSFLIAPAATALAMIFGTLASVGLSRGNFRFKGLIMAFLISPMIVPLVIVAVGLYFFFAKLQLLNSYIGLVLAHAMLGVPFVVITVNATLQGFDTNLSRAAASLGAPPLTVFFKVMLPLIAPGVISGGLFAFATSFDEVVVTLFLSSPSQRTLPLQMFSGIRENISPNIAAVATIMVILSVLMLLTLEVLRRRNEKLKIKQQ
ncbi:ABC transporter permease [Pseudomonas sp. CCC3.1]|uniref:ABC transporter permease n=1 Tax=Pseudomonas sp. CCC3.1 TaxID=3048607 RepID=UPI002AC94D4E|nr:ABC transporter permease [Pseudomonas sp. CCC3.1]MEB0206166.1 ABC transporter permease [Pseudomonas sp. CCC3.1]WPX39152.1 ABC transporter permease [Pseudomonas sp. CCC3.1]